MAIYEMEPYEFNVTDTLKDENGDYHISLEPIHSTEDCPYCGSGDIIRFGSKVKAVRDIPMFGGRVELLVNNPRYKCKECNNSFFNRYQSIEDGKRMTNRLREYIKKQSLLKPFSVITEDLGVSDTAVKNIFAEYVAELDAARELKAPQVLGIDENHLCKQYRAVFVDVTEGKLLEMLPNKSKESVKDFVKSLPNYKDIQCFTIDMWRPYRSAIYELIPDAIIIVDKFHVIKEINNALDKIRKRVHEDDDERKFLKNTRYNLLHNMEDFDLKQQAVLLEVFERFPELETPHYLKEEFRNIYSCKTKAEAVSKFKIWELSIKGISEYEKVANTVNNWFREIFNYFSYRYTNATTESLNKLINVIDDRGRGYTFDVLRAKALYGTKATKPAKFKSITKWPSRELDSNVSMRIMTSYNFHDMLPNTERVLVEGWGVDINKLLREIENGCFFNEEFSDI